MPSMTAHIGAGTIPADDGTVARKRGRPRKVRDGVTADVDVDAKADVQSDEAVVVVEEQLKPKRKGGSRKVKEDCIEENSVPTEEKPKKKGKGKNAKVDEVVREIEKDSKVQEKPKSNHSKIEEVAVSSKNKDSTTKDESKSQPEIKLNETKDLDSGIQVLEPKPHKKKQLTKDQGQEIPKVDKKADEPKPKNEEPQTQTNLSVKTEKPKVEKAKVDEPVNQKDDSENPPRENIPEEVQTHKITEVAVVEADIREKKTTRKKSPSPKPKKQDELSIEAADNQRHYASKWSNNPTAWERSHKQIKKN